MRIIALIICFCFLSLFGCCMQIQRIEVQKMNNEIRISPERSHLLVKIASKIGTDEKPVIDIDRSFAKSPSNKLLTLKIKNNEYLAKTQSSWSADYISLIDPKMINKKPKWDDGVWNIHLFFAGANPRSPLHVSFKLSSVYYCPIIHGPPN